MAAPVYTNLRAAGAYFANVTASASANTEGSYNQLTASTPSASSRIHVFNGHGDAGGLFFLIDIATGAGGAEVVVIADIFQHWNVVVTAGSVVPFELDIAASTRIAARCQCSSAGSHVTSLMILHEDRATAGLGATATYGATAASSKGTSLDPGSGGTKSGYIQLTASTSPAHRALVLCAGLDAVGEALDSYVQWAIDLATGAAASEVVKVPDIHHNAWTTGDQPHQKLSKWIVDVPASTRLAVRALAVQSDGTTGIASAADRTLSLLVIGTDSIEAVPPSLAKLGTTTNIFYLAGGSAHTKGSYTELEDSTAFASSRIHIGHPNINVASRFALHDWATGAAASEVVKIANVHEHAGSDITCTVLAPVDLDIPASTRIACRGQSDTASERLNAWAILEDRALTGLSAPATYGAVTASSRGTIVDPGGTADTKGSYVTITSATSGATQALVALVGGPNAAEAIAAFQVWAMDLATGAGGSEVVQIPDITFWTNDVGNAVAPPAVRFDVQIAASTRIAARAKCSVNTATDREINLSLLGMQAASGAQKVTQVVLSVVSSVTVEADPPPSVTACTGSGTLPSGTNPSAGTSLATMTTPLAWLKFTLGATTYRYSTTAINQTTAKEPRVLKMGKCARGLTDSHGQPEFPSMRILLADYDRSLRGLMTSTWINTPVTVYVQDATTAEANARPYFHGVMRTFRPLPGLQAEMILESRLTLLTATGRTEKQLPQRLIDGSISDQNPPEPVNGLPVPLWFGNLSDEADSNPQGVVPGKYIASETPSFLSDNLHKFLIGQMATKNIQSTFLANYVSGGDEPTTRIKAPTSAYDDVIYIPHQSALLGRFTDQGGLRYTFAYGLDAHPAIELARSGRIPLLFNLCGAESIGDGTGTMYSNPARITALILNNKLAQEASATWLSILSLGTYTFLDMTAIEAVATICAARSYVWAGGIGTDDRQQNWREVIADCCRNGDFDFGENRFGQVFLTMLDRTSAYSSATLFVDGLHVRKDSLSIDPNDDDTENEIQYVYKRRYDTPLQPLNPAEGARTSLDKQYAQWNSGLLTDPDETVITAMGGRPLGLLQSQVQEYNFVRDSATATDLARQRREKKKNPRATATFTIRMSEGDAIELGDVIKLTHFAGVSGTGWTARRLQVRRIEDDLDEFTRTLTCLDVDNLLA